MKRMANTSCQTYVKHLSNSVFQPLVIFDALDAWQSSEYATVNAAPWDLFGESYL